MPSDVGVWEPKRPLHIEAKKLRHYVAVMAAADARNLAASLSADELEADAALMQQREESWDAASELGDDDIETLIRFFTLAEMQLSGWDGGKQSPVIYLVKILKDRGTFTPELRKWIKSNTDNRYLPYGSVL